MQLIRSGQRSPAVADLQLRLDSLGFRIAESELGGAFGPSTESAVKELQQRRGLDVDGIVGEATWRELVESSWELGDRPLRLSSPLLRGDDVRELQMQLNALGFNAGKHDGIFGKRTDHALRDFQRNLAIEEDGISGHETLRALQRLRLVIKPGLGPRITEREARRAAPPGLPGKRIALDPGHGGNDVGEAGTSGVTEAELAFGLAAKTALLLDARGAVTMLTRGPHDNPSESDRAQLANSFAADLLVSVHFNAHRLSVAKGAATYYFQHAEVASEPGEHLAGLIQDRFLAAGLADCRTHGKAYPLLRETVMPAVLAEPGFLSNPAEVKLLTDPAGMDLLARALVDAAEAYFSSD